MVSGHKRSVAQVVRDTFAVVGSFYTLAFLANDQIVAPAINASLEAVDVIAGALATALLSFLLGLVYRTKTVVVFSMVIGTAWWVLVAFLQQALPTLLLALVQVAAGGVTRRVIAMTSPEFSSAQYLPQRIALVRSVHLVLLAEFLVLQWALALEFQTDLFLAKIGLFSEAYFFLRIVSQLGPFAVTVFLADASCFFLWLIVPPLCLVWRARMKPILPRRFCALGAAVPVTAGWVWWAFFRPRLIVPGTELFRGAQSAWVVRCCLLRDDRFSTLVSPSLSDVWPWVALYFGLLLLCFFLLFFRRNARTK